MGSSQKLCTTLMTWKARIKLLQIIAENIANYNRVHVHNEGLRIIHMSELNSKNIAFNCRTFYKLRRKLKLSLWQSPITLF